QRGVPGAGPGTTPVATAPAGPGSGPAIIRRPSGTSAPTATAPTTPTTPTTGPAPRRGPPTATTPPTATPPATNMGPQRRPPTTTAPPTTATPPAGAGPQRSGGFPIAAGSFGSNVRNAPSASATKIGSTGNGQTLTLLETGANTYQGYPWFKIRMPDGTSGYQWGGGTCYFGAPIAGLKGACPFVATASPSGPTRSTSAGPTRPTAGTTTTGPVRPAGPVRPGGPGPNGGPQVATGNPNIGTAMGGGPNPNSFGADGQEDGAPMGRYADYSALDPQAVDACNTANPADVDYYACLDGKMDDFVASGGTVSLPEPRIYRSYNQLGQAVLTACSNANPTNAKYYDCLDGELRKLVPPGTDLRSFDDYSTLADGSPTGNGAYQYCATQGNSNTPAYFDCLDQQTGRYRVATETAQMAPAPGGGPDPNAFGADGQEDNPEIDPNAQNDYSMVSDADEHDCDVNNPADGDYYICMNGRKAAVLANGGPGDVDLNPLHMPDGSSIPNGLYQSCAQSYGEGSQDYKSCVDSGVVGMAIGELNTTDSRKNDDHSLVTRDTLNTCWAQTMPDIGALLDCVGVAQMQAEHANAQAGGPDPNAFGADGQEDSSAEDYSMVGAADQQYCDLNNPNDADYYACMKAAKDAVLAGGAPSQGTPQLADETPQMGADLNPQNDEQAIRDAAASSYPDLSDEERAGCETYGLGTQSYWDCLEAVRTSKAEAQNDQTSYGDPAASDNGQSSDGQVYAAPSGDGSARVSDLISQECQSQHGDTGGQCESDVGACAASYPDLGGSDFEACVGEYGW
ncbi:MAG: SH3 domain-containing protein, partial [Alphaproteobacteria bacterium]|nr:SH3 domain-containing protein [Alphaproteobacteria bacterium]